MATAVKVSDLTSAPSINLTETIYVVKSGTSYKTTFAAVFSSPTTQGLAYSTNYAVHAAMYI